MELKPLFSVLPINIFLKQQKRQELTSPPVAVLVPALLVLAN
jgi:hypothetical protein